LIEKFNFYDIYGYFLPGAVFLAILWMPFGLVKGSWPPSNWSSAVIAAALAYIAGHLIQSIATNAIPSWEVKDPSGRNRYPSEIFLDPENKELPVSAKNKIAEFMNAQFGLNLRIDVPGDKTIDGDRHNGFLFARQILIQGQAVSYAEQFQGMYALTRGLVSAFALGLAYWLGWAAPAVIGNRFFADVVILLMAVAMLALINIPMVWLPKISDSQKKYKVELGYASLLFVAFLAIGCALGLRYSPTPRQSALLTINAGWALVACPRVYGAYKFFARRFASTVWRDYLAYNVKPSGAAKSDGEKK
jgi:hypothetical protein